MEDVVLGVIVILLPCQLLNAGKIGGVKISLALFDANIELMLTGHLEAYEYCPRLTMDAERI